MALEFEEVILRRSSVRRGSFGTGTNGDVWVLTVTADQLEALEIQQVVTSIDLQHQRDGVLVGAARQKHASELYYHYQDHHIEDGLKPIIAAYHSIVGRSQQGGNQPCGLLA
jgi:hypothetical protein